MFKVFVGPESFLMRNALSKELAGREAVAHYDELTPEVFQAGSQMTLFGDTQTIVLHLDEIGSGDELLRLLKQPAGCCDYFITATKLDKRSSAYRFLKNKPELVLCDKVSESDFQRYVFAYLKKHGMRITDNAYRLLVQRSDYFSSEQVNLDTVFMYLKQMGFLSSDVTEQEVLQVLPEVEGGKVFDLSNLLISGRKDELFPYAERLLDAGESPIGMMSLLLRNFRLGLKAALLSDRRTAEISKMIGVPSFQFEKLEMKDPDLLEKAIAILQDGIKGIKRGKGSPRVLFIYTLGSLSSIF